MTIEKTFIEGLLLIRLDKFIDNRGGLLKPFSTRYFEELHVNLDFKETWFTYSSRDVIRGMHLQTGANPTEKLVSVIRGRLIDVVLDLRKESGTYGRYFEKEMNADSPCSLYIPRGCAHGYRVLEDDTITLYMATGVHVAADDTGIRWDSFGYDWGIENPVISVKDAGLPQFQGRN